MRSRRRSQHVRKRVFSALVFLFLIFVGIGFVRVAKFFPVFWDLMFKKEVSLKQTPENRINLLILGVGGGTHEGPDLTDTIIFTSLDPKTKHITLVSLPRDLWIPDLSAKVNSAYTYGE